MQCNAQSRCRKVRRFSRRPKSEPHLVDVDHLRHSFRQYFLTGLKHLQRQGSLKLDGDFAHLQDTSNFEAWLEPLEQLKWNTCIEPPPGDKAAPEHVLKYLARHLTGGPISEGRLISHENGKVTFRARSGKTPGGNRADTQTVTLPGVEFGEDFGGQISNNE